MNRSLSVCPLSAPHMVFLAGCNSINSHQLSPPPLFSCWTCQVMFCGSYVWLRPPSRVWERVEVGSMGRDGPVWTGDWDWTSLSWETITSPPPPPPPSFLLCLSTTVLLFLCLALTLRLFHPSPGALHTPLFIYASGGGNGLPPREEGWKWGEQCVHMDVCVCVCLCSTVSI